MVLRELQKMRNPLPVLNGTVMGSAAQWLETYPELTLCRATAQRLKRFAQSGIKPFQDFWISREIHINAIGRASTKLFGHPTVAKLSSLHSQV
jgi:hypothetical protein